MNAPVEWALPGWLAGREAIQEQIRRRVAANLGVLDRQLFHIAGRAAAGRRGRVVRCAPDSGARTGRSDGSRALERGVWVHPGYFFGMPESGWLVISLLTMEPEFSNGVCNPD